MTSQVEERPRLITGGYGRHRRQWVKGPGKRGHVVADTLLLMMFLGLRKLRNICCRHKMFLNKIRNIFVSRTQNLCPQQMLRARGNGKTFVSATMCPQQCVLACQGLKLPKYYSKLLKHFPQIKIHLFKQKSWCSPISRASLSVKQNKARSSLIEVKSF